MNSQKKQASVNGESEIVNSFFILEEATSSPGKDIQLPARQFLIFFVPSLVIATYVCG
jgi:hypothetical protein